MTVVGVAGLHGFRDLVTALGGDPQALLARVRIPVAALDDPRNFVPLTSIVALFEKAARTLDCADFGLRLAARQDVGILGPLAVAVQNSSTLGDALDCASRFIFTYSPAIAFSGRPAEREDRVLVAYELDLPHPVSAGVQDAELSMGLAARIVNLLSEGRHHLRSVRFAHPRCAPAAVYRKHFGVPVHFESACTALEVDRADLDLPIRSGHRGLRDLAEHYLVTQYGERRQPFAERVRDIVLRSLGTRQSHAECVARALAMHPRALQRRLAADGTSFGRIKDEARARLARRYLAQEDLPLSRVAALLDYSEQSALTRSCHRWFARSPRAMRERLARGGRRAGRKRAAR
ncbi:HTH-type transcriptional regulator VirS [Myxococcaceae bacterium]|nr:HTH-type transcriptional regulator VirS [Myxococcaceae bacterium]